MASFKGGGAAKLGAFLHSLIDFTAHAPKETETQPHGEQSMSQQPKSSTSSGGLITALVSAIALIFSGFSFYETVLKQAELKIYAPPLVNLYRKGYRDVFAIPVTISNDGAKRGTILSFDLEVTNLDTNETKQFQNLYFGNDPKDTSRIFSPLTIAGRSSHSDIVMFFAKTTGAFFETTGGVKLNLHLKLTMNVDQTEYWFTPKKPQQLTIDMSANFIQSFRNMEKGIPTVLHDKSWKTLAKQQQAADKEEDKTSGQQ